MRGHCICLQSGSRGILSVTGSSSDSEDRDPGVIGFPRNSVMIKCFRGLAESEIAKISSENIPRRY